MVPSPIGFFSYGLPSNAKVFYGLAMVFKYVHYGFTMDFAMVCFFYGSTMVHQKNPVPKMEVRNSPFCTLY